MLCTPRITAVWAYAESLLDVLRGDAAEHPLLLHDIQDRCMAVHDCLSDSRVQFHTASHPGKIATMLNARQQDVAKLLTRLVS